MYVYENPVRIDPGECRFYIHPSLRLALGAESATELYPYRSALISSQLHQAALDFNLGNVIGGGIVIRPNSRTVRLRSVTRSGDRIVRRLEELDLPSEIAREVYDQIQSMLTDTREIQDQILSGRADDSAASPYVRWAISFLSYLGSRLQQGSVGDDENIRVLARTLEDEARRLGDEYRSA